MSEKIPYFLTELQKEELREYLVSVNYANNWDDWIFDQLKQIILSTKKYITNSQITIQKGNQTFNIPLDVEKLQKIKVIRDKKFKKSGKKSIIMCGVLMLEGLENAYKMEKFLSKTEKTAFASSLEQFVNDYIGVKMDDIIIKNYDKKLEKERNLLKKEQENKNKSNKE